MVRSGEKEEREANEKAPLLDMLAEVASYTLNCQSNGFDDSVVVSETESSSTACNVQHQENNVLNLEQIRSLSDKNLLEQFSEYSCDELRRHYSYTCRLLPGICNASVESFASEEMSKNSMKSHLLNHISKLDQSFTAVAGRNRRRRRLEEQSSKSRKTRSSPVCFAKTQSKNRKLCVSSPNKRINSSNITKEGKAFDSKRKLPKKKVKIRRGVISEVTMSSSPLIKQRPSVLTKRIKCTLFDEQMKSGHDCEDFICNTYPSNELSNSYNVIFLHSDNLKTNDDEELNYEVVTCDPSQALVFSMNVPFTIADHSYTCTDGPKQALSQSFEQISNKAANKGTNSKRKTAIATPAFPYVYEPLLPNVCEVVEVGTSELDNVCQEVLNHETIEKKDSVKGSNTTKIVHQPVKKQTPGKAQWEREFALKCIEDLRSKRHDNVNENPSSVSRCQICDDKTFMSVSSLLYHYRGHAGIKPYECTICDATFTRQHSLNYHMLIHYNKTRFVCEECGRHFRHPSHFKEHMRRHTGETPYECIDCSVKFKTRNTYKRHLQTKHGKILTAKGIYEAPNNSSQPKKPCAPRRKYGLGYLHQNIEAIAQFEKAQLEFEKHERATEGDVLRQHAVVTCSSDSLNQLLQAAALAAYERNAVEDQGTEDSNNAL